MSINAVGGTGINDFSKVEATCILLYLEHKIGTANEREVMPIPYIQRRADLMSEYTKRQRMDMLMAARTEPEWERVSWAAISRTAQKWALEVEAKFGALISRMSARELNANNDTVVVNAYDMQVRELVSQLVTVLGLHEDHAYEGIKCNHDVTEWLKASIARIRAVKATSVYNL